jgi:hypothetical protein
MATMTLLFGKLPESWKSSPAEAAERVVAPVIARAYIGYGCSFEQGGRNPAMQADSGLTIVNGR